MLVQQQQEYTLICVNSSLNYPILSTTTLKVMTALNSSPDAIIAGRTLEDWTEFVMANKPGEKDVKPSYQYYMKIARCNEQCCYVKKYCSNNLICLMF